MNRLELNAAIARAGMTQQQLAEKLGISMVQMSRKMNGVSDFWRHEINSMRHILHLSDDDTVRIFFTDKVS